MNREAFQEAKADVLALPKMFANVENNGADPVTLAETIIMMLPDDGKTALERELQKVTFQILALVGKMFPATAERILEVLREDDGEIITPEFKDRIVSQISQIWGR